MRRILCLLRLLAAILVAGVIPAPPARADAAWQWPVPAPARVVRGFEPPAHDWLPGHRGVDLAGRVGQPVMAAGAGTVAFAGTVGRVPVVTIRHADGLETTYEPVHPLVRAGTPVAAGAVVGVLLRIGSHCAPQACLHWACRHWGLGRAESYLDPLSLLGRARIRLLPLLSAPGHSSWLAPAVSGASVGSSAVAVGWAGLVLRRRRRRLPPGVTSLASVRRERAGGG